MTSSIIGSGLYWNELWCNRRGIAFVGVMIFHSNDIYYTTAYLQLIVSHIIFCGMSDLQISI